MGNWLYGPVLTELKTSRIIKKYVVYDPFVTRDYKTYFSNTEPTKEQLATDFNLEHTDIVGLSLYDPKDNYYILQTNMVRINGSLVNKNKTLQEICTCINIEFNSNIKFKQETNQVIEYKDLQEHESYSVII